MWREDSVNADLQCIRRHSHGARVNSNVPRLFYAGTIVAVQRHRYAVA